MKLNPGELITLDGDKQYIVVDRIICNKVNYVYLMSNFKPLDIRFGREILEGEDVSIQMVSDPEEKKYVLEAFVNKNGNK